MNKLKRIYEGRVHSQSKYDKPTRIHIIGINQRFPKYQTSAQFSFSRFLADLENCYVRLTLEVLDKKEYYKKLEVKKEK